MPACTRITTSNQRRKAMSYSMKPLNFGSSEKVTNQRTRNEKPTQNTDEAPLQHGSPEYFRLLDLYTQRKDSNRRSPERVEKPIDLKPSISGARIVNWSQYLELVERSEAQYPPKPYGAKQ